MSNRHIQKSRLIVTWLVLTVGVTSQTAAKREKPNPSYSSASESRLNVAKTLG